jgi:flagellar biosynthesis protein FlhF
LSWRESASRRPLQAKQIAQLLCAGFSPALARALAAKLPADFSNAQAALWLQESLIRNLSVAPAADDMVDRGGVYALVGPTGVGKTTTAAKLAARCVVKHGVKSLGLITIDNFRIGGEDQLRAYGKILGVTVHTARDAQSLADLIALMRDKHLVLIDTVGMGQRDSRMTEQLQMLSSPGIVPVLLLNASAQGETLEDVVRLYGGQGPRRTAKVIVSKIDEAVKYGFVLDCIVRHKLQMQYVTNGQRVPEDLHPANPKYLVHRALHHGAAPAFALDDAEIPLVLSKAPAVKPVAHHA